MKDSRMKKFLTGTAIATAGLFVTAGMVAAEPSIVVPIDDIEAGPVGSTVIVGTADVGPEFQNVPCIATAIVRNQESEHPNNDLIISSGDDTIVIPDVESLAFETTEYQLPIVLGETVTVSLRFGADGYFSGGIDVQFDCSQTIPTSSDVPPTTAPEPPEPAPSDPTTTPPSTTPPVSPTTTPGGPGPVTTVPGSGTPDPRDILPETGANLSTALVALGLVTLGAGVLVVARRTPRSS
jgi:LPXTG-motif cell wall-anchored protein